MIWWVTGLRALYSLLVARPETFELSEIDLGKEGSALGTDVLKRTRVRLTKNSIVTAVESSSTKKGSEFPKNTSVIHRGACAVQPQPTILLVCPETCVVLNKPSGVSTEATSKWLSDRLGGWKISTVSRLDKGTSGAVVFPSCPSAVKVISLPLVNLLFEAVSCSSQREY